MELSKCKLFLFSVSLLASASSQQTLVFDTGEGGGEGRYLFQYNEETASDFTIGGLVSDRLPDGFFSVNCLLDGETSSSITYTIQGANENDVFQVDENTGDLSLQADSQLDYESRTSYQFGVQCSAPSVTTPGVAQVDFNVLPVNEYRPVPDQNPIPIVIPETTAIDTIVASTRTDEGALVIVFSVADDDDGPDGELRYTLGFNDNMTSFAVDPLTGSLSVTQSLDADNTPNGFMSEEVRLTVCDVKPATSSCPGILLLLFITAADDNLPVFSQELYTVRVLESVAMGSIIATVSCTDGDSGVGLFKNITLSSGLFNVTTDPTEQTVGLNGLLDFETARTHNISLTCYDSVGNIARATLVVTVLPVNDNMPRFTSTSFFFTINRILTTGNEVGRVIVVDGDLEVGGELIYTMTGDDNFQIQGDGSIILEDFVYIIEGQVFMLEVTVSDGEFSDTATVEILVNGVLNVPEIILICMGAIVFLVLVVFIIVFCCYCCVCCSRLIPKQRHVDVDVPVYMNEHAMVDGPMMAMPMTMVGPAMYAGKGPAYMVGQIPAVMEHHWGARSIEEESEDEIDPDLVGSIVTASSRVYSPTPFLKEMVEMFKEGDDILDGKKSKPKKKK